MHLGWKSGVFALAAAFLSASGAAAQPANSAASHRQAITPSHPGYRHGNARIDYAPGVRGIRSGHHAHFADLVGDPQSGLGFYALPLQYRVGAWRYRMRNARPPWANPVRQAVVDDAVRSWSWIPTEATSYRYGVFDPNEGVGTPFFAGYYSVGDRDGSSDDEDPYFPFGRPIAR